MRALPRAAGLLCALTLCITSISVRSGRHEPIPWIDASANNILPAERASMRPEINISENIVVFHITIDEEIHFSADNLYSAIVSKFGSGFKAAFPIYLFIWRNRVSSDQPSGGTILWRKRQRDGRHKSDDLGNDPCRALSVIFDVEKNCGEDRGSKVACCRVFSALLLGHPKSAHSDVFYEDVRALDIDEPPLRDVDMLNGNFPKPGSRAPKSECEERKKNCREGSNCPLIRVGEISSTGNIEVDPGSKPYDRGADNGATLVKGAIGLLVLALVYAVLKRF